MKQPLPYVPNARITPGRLLDVPSAWKGIEAILFSLIREFQVQTHVAIDFGVEYGYSTAALANYFGVVYGVDTFRGMGHDRLFLAEVNNSMEPFSNVFLLPMRWQFFASVFNGEVDLIHVDIDHDYDATYECGEWSVQHAPVVLFHDTLSYADIPTASGIRACGDLAEKYDLHYYNFEESHGLGILSRMEKR